MIRSVRAKNLFSWADLNFTFPHGLSQITGFNHDDGTSEGSGKSSIPDIVTWTLWGKTPKDVLIDECIKEGEKDAEGEVELASGAKITRRKGKDHGLFFTSPAGVVSKTSNEEVAKLVMSFEMFCQTVYFAQNYPRKFITADEETKAKILTESRGLQVYDSAKKLAEDQLKAILDKNKADEVYLNDYAERLKEAQTQHQWFTDKLADFENERRNYIESLLAQIEALRAKAEVKDLSDLKDEQDSIKARLDEIRKALPELVAQQRTAKLIVESNRRARATIADLKKRQAVLAQAAEEHGDTCPVCKQGAAPEILAAHRAKKQEELLALQLEEQNVQGQIQPEAPSPEGLVELEAEEAKLKTRNLSVEQALRQGLQLNSAAQANLEQIANLRSQRAAAKLKKPDDLEQKQAEFAAKVEELTLAYERKQAELAKGRELADQLETLRQSYRKIKSDIFQTALMELTRNTNAYLQELFDTPVRLRFENVLDRKIVKIKTFVTINGKERSLGLYSGGQFRRIALAVDLALSKMVSSRSNKPFNLRVLDEPCKDLSARSKEKFMDLVRALPGSTVIIEHDKEIQATIDNTFHVELRNGTSMKAS